MKAVEAVDMSNPQELAAAAENEVWFHSIKLGHAVVTKVQKTAPTLAKELEALQLPPLAGRSVLDIGAHDGFYSFEAERRGAVLVVSMDIHAWEIETRLAGDFLLCEFFPGNELNGDYSNWWRPNIRALEGLVRAAELKSIEVVQGPPSIAGIPAGSPPVRYRAMVHARKQ